MNLTPHFTLHEFTRSQTASRLGIDNGLPSHLLPTARATCEMLERIRTLLGVPVLITSGYRCLTLNRNIGSHDASDHVGALAADIEAPGFGSCYEVARRLALHIDDLGIGQVILEYPDRDGWVHVSTRRPAKAINRIITIKSTGTQAGIVR